MGLFNMSRRRQKNSSTACPSELTDGRMPQIFFVGAKHWHLPVCTSKCVWNNFLCSWKIDKKAHPKFTCFQLSGKSTSTLLHWDAMRLNPLKLSYPYGSEPGQWYPGWTWGLVWSSHQSGVERLAVLHSRLFLWSTGPSPKQQPLDFAGLVRLKSQVHHQAQVCPGPSQTR